MKKKETSWGNVAEWYNDMLDSADSYQERVILPNILRLVDAKPGMCLLDLACGQGYFSRAFAEKGALVTGIDISPELIDIAKKSSQDKVSYLVGSAENFSNLPEMKDVSCEAATMILAIQNIENINAVFAEVRKILKPNGRFVIVLNHPAYRIPKRSSWVWDEKENRQYRRIDAYMSDSSEKIDMTPGGNKEKKFTVSFHRPLQSYFKAINKAGLVVTRLEEWISHKKSQPGPRGSEEDRIRKEIPMFLCIEVRKIPSGSL